MTMEELTIVLLAEGGPVVDDWMLLEDAGVEDPGTEVEEPDSEVDEPGALELAALELTAPDVEEPGADVEEAPPVLDDPEAEVVETAAEFDPSAVLEAAALVVDDDASSGTGSMSNIIGTQP